MKFLVLALAIVAACTALPVADDKNLWMYSGKVEGDMVLTPEQYLAKWGLLSRNGLVNTRYRWPNNEVPYAIVSGYFSQSQMNLIHEAVAEFAQISCLTVRPKTANDRHYVQVTGQNTGCYSSVGYLAGVQTLNLAQGCLYKRIIQHEFLHAIGFYHQQSTYDRDDYVTIQWNNIIPGMEYNFDKFSSSVVQNFGTTYDYESVMHYDAYGFSKNGYRTIVTKDPAYQNIIGQRSKLSEKDIKKLNAMYCE